MGGYWDRKGTTEIDIVAINEIDRTSLVGEVKHNAARHDERTLHNKVEAVLAAASELRHYDLTIKPLTPGDM